MEAWLQSMYQCLNLFYNVQQQPELIQNSSSVPMNKLALYPAETPAKAAASPAKGWRPNE